MAVPHWGIGALRPQSHGEQGFSVGITLAERSSLNTYHFVEWWINSHARLRSKRSHLIDMGILSALDPLIPEVATEGWSQAAHSCG